MTESLKKLSDVCSIIAIRSLMYVILHEIMVRNCGINQDEISKKKNMQFLNHTELKTWISTSKSWKISRVTDQLSFNNTFDALLSTISVIVF